MLLLTESLITFKGEFVIFAAKLKDDSLLLKEILLSHNGEFVSIKGWKNNGGNVEFNGRIVIEPHGRPVKILFCTKKFSFCTKRVMTVCHVFAPKYHNDFTPNWF